MSYRTRHKDDVYSDCRYGGNVETVFDGWTVVKDASIADYQGDITVWFTKDGEHKIVQFSYGSCSGCDDWEDRDLENDQIEQEIRELTMTFSSQEEAAEQWERFVKD